MNYTKPRYQLTRGGTLTKQVSKFYQVSENPALITNIFTSSPEEVVLLLHDSMISLHFDLVCTIPVPIILLQSTIEKLKATSIKKYLKIQENLSKLSNFFVLLDHFSVDNIINKENNLFHCAYSKLLPYANFQKKKLFLLTTETSNQPYHISPSDLAKKYPKYFVQGIPFGEEYPVSCIVDCYQNHLSESEAILRIKQGTLVKGKICFDPIDNLKATLFWSTYDITIHINGRINQNRAIHGDFVAVEILQSVENSSSNYSKGIDDNEEAIDNTFEKNNQLPLVFLEMLKSHKKEFQSSNFEGTVKFIFPRDNIKICGDIIEPNEEPNLGCVAKFVPFNSRFPMFYVRIPFLNAFQGVKVQCVVQGWPNNALLPLAFVSQVLGPTDTTEVDNKVILLEYGVDYAHFPMEALEELPPDNWVIPDEELKKRSDFRNLCVASVDPPGCKDIDDALHARLLQNGNVEVGVHIADVTHYVKPLSHLDVEAAKRCTTVYLVGKRTDMLPKVLTENLCSLKCNVDRLAFSAIWEITKDGNIVNCTYHKSVIHSRASLEYEQAQKIIDNKNDDSELAQSLRLLNNLAKILKQKRVDSGALTLASTQVKFKFSDEDQEAHSPSDVSLYKMFDTNYMVEEFMLLANIYVAMKIFEHYPTCSILRLHPTPQPSKLLILEDMLKKKGFNLNYKTNKELSESLDKIRNPNDNFFNTLVRILTTRTMNEAKYFSSVDHEYHEFYHYGLAAPIYTHFTSPIRRYADVLVHRLLAAAIDWESIPSFMCNKEAMLKQCNQLNYRNKNARNCSRSSSDLEIYRLLKKSIPKCRGYIIKIHENGAACLLEKYGIEGLIPIELLQKNEDGCLLHNKKILNLFDVVLVDVKIELIGMRKQVILNISEQNKKRPLKKTYQTLYNFN